MADSAKKSEDVYRKGTLIGGRVIRWKVQKKVGQYWNPSAYESSVQLETVHPKKSEATDGH